MHSAVSAAALLVALGFPLVPATAVPMTYSVALDRAAAFAPSIRATAASTAAARSAAISADRLPDPTLDLGLKDFPVTGPDAGRFNRDNFTMTTVGVSQRFPNLAKRHAEAARAVAGIGEAQAGELIESRSVRLQTALAWIDLHYAERRLARLALLEHSLDDLEKTLPARLAAGAARPAQALEPAELRAALADRRAEMAAAIAQAQARLTRFTGDPDPDVAGSPPALVIDRVRLTANLDSLPALRALDAAAGTADAETRLARAGKHPDWTVSASYGRREPNYGDLASLGVSIDLPLFAGKRQDPKIAARASEAQRARLDREAAGRELAAALEADLADHAMHHSRLQNARETLVPLARKREDLERASYGAGKTDLGTALLATLALAEAEVEALNREAEVARDAIRIDVTYGEERP